ncbi:MAG: hypothetical protein V5B38_03835 [Candidatus Accumulibacter propinquus]
MAAPVGDRSVALCQPYGDADARSGRLFEHLQHGYAKAWVDQITIHNAVDLAHC